MYTAKMIKLEAYVIRITYIVGKFKIIMCCYIIEIEYGFV